MTNQVLRRSLAVVILLVPLLWYGGRQSLLPDSWTTGIGGWLGWGIALLALLVGAWLWATSTSRSRGPDDMA